MLFVFININFLFGIQAFNDNNDTFTHYNDTNTCQKVWWVKLSYIYLQCDVWEGRAADGWDKGLNCIAGNQKKYK